MQQLFAMSPLSAVSQVTRAGGFSLTELLVALGILLLVLAAAAPNMAQMSSGRQAEAASEGLVRATAQARALAVQSGARTTLLVNGEGVAACGDADVAWAIVRGSTALGCLTQRDFAARYQGASLSGPADTRIDFAPTGLGDNLSSEPVYSFDSGGQQVQVRINAGGSAQVL